MSHQKLAPSVAGLLLAPYVWLDLRRMHRERHRPRRDPAE
jgi:hypothetical protein